MRKMIIASHDKMAFGVKSTIDFITNHSFDVYEISAYTEGVDLEKDIANLIQSFSRDDQVIILTDMLSGSVNQQILNYRNDHINVIAGFNLPLALEILLFPQDHQLSEDDLLRLIENSKQQIQLVQDAPITFDGDE